MKKKFSSYSVIATVMLLAIFLAAGCSQPVEYPANTTYVETAPTLETPKDLKAVAYPGLIVFSWAPVPNAAGYEVYRRDNVTGTVRLLADTRYFDVTVTPKETRYVDIVGFVNNPNTYIWGGAQYQNELVNGRSYSYSVIAFSGKAIVSRSLTADDIVFNSSASVDVKANVPDPLGNTVPAAPKNIRYQVTDNDLLRVTWDADPSAIYTIEYLAGDKLDGPKVDAVGSGNTTIGANGSSFVINDTHYSFDNPLGYADFPLVGGKTTIAVRADFVGKTNSVEPYYPNYKTTSITINETLDALVRVTGFSATRVTDSDAHKVRLQWNNNNGTHATEYKIYKVEYAADPQWDSYFDDELAVGEGKGIKVSGNWIAVETTPPLLDITNDRWTAVESVQAVDRTKKYVYLIIASSGGNTKKVSTPAATTLGVVTLAAPALSITVDRPGTAPYADTYVPNVYLSWPTEKEYTYKLYRYELLKADDATTILGLGPKTEKTLDASYSAGYAWLKDTGLGTRKSYRYELEYTRDGVSRTIYKDLDQTVDVAFSRAVQFDLSLSNTGDIPGTVTATLTATAGWIYDHPDVTILYRRNAPTLDDHFTSAGTFGYNAGTYTPKVIDNLDPGATYSFQISDPTVGTRKLANTGTKTGTRIASKYDLSVGSVSYAGIPDSTSLLSGGNHRVEITGANTNYLNGAQIRYRYRTSPAGAWSAPAIATFEKVGVSSVYAAEIFTSTTLGTYDVEFEQTASTPFTGAVHLTSLF